MLDLTGKRGPPERLAASTRKTGQPFGKPSGGRSGEASWRQLHPVRDQREPSPTAAIAKGTTRRAALPIADYEAVLRC